MVLTVVDHALWPVTELRKNLEVGQPIGHMKRNFASRVLVIVGFPRD